MSFFEDLLSKIPLPKNLSALGSSSPSVIGIDIGSSAIKVVQMKRQGGKAVLETYGELALGPYAGIEIGRATNLPAERIGEGLADLLREANVTSRDSAISIPLSATLITLMDLPALSEKRMDEMVPLEARRYVPVPISEVTLDWWVIPKEEQVFTSPEGASKEPKESGRTNVLLVAIINEALERLRRVTKDAALENPIFEIEIFATVRAVLDHGIEAVMIMDMGAASTKLYLVEHGIVKDSHIINKGSQDVTLALSRALSVPVAKAEEIKRSVGLSTEPANKQTADTIALSLDYIFTETNRVLLSFEKRFNKTVKKIVLTGGGAVMPGFLQAAKVRLQAEAEAGDPFLKLATPAFLEKKLKEIGPEFAVAVGVALRKLSQFE